MTGKKLAASIDCMASAGRRDEAGRMPGARLLYNPGTPFEVGLELENADGQVVLWRLSRDLLHLALLDRSETPTGPGDVQVSVAQDEVRLELSSPTGYVALWLPEPEVRRFVLGTLGEVPLGTEAQRIDWDQVIHQMLEEAQS